MSWDKYFLQGMYVIYYSTVNVQILLVMGTLQGLHLVLSTKKSGGDRKSVV